MLIRQIISIVLVFFSVLVLQAAPPITQYWNAKWIAHPTASPFDYGVYYFRKIIDLKEKPESFWINVSGDNRYILYVNGQEVSEGPARSDATHWHFETIDIAPYLQQGQNILAAHVINLGEHRPFAQHSVKTAFLLQGNSPETHLANTDKTWKVFQSKAYYPIEITNQMAKGYYVAGPCDSVILANRITNWKNNNFDDSDWVQAKNVSNANLIEKRGDSPWTLTPRNIPAMEKKKEYINSVARSTISIPTEWLKGQKALIIPPYTQTTILLDHKQLTVGYLSYLFSNGKGSKIKAIYSEALYDKDGSKGNRNDIKDKTIAGYHDIFLPSGNQMPQEITTLWLRTFRFLQLEITTAETPLIIHEIYNTFTAYPLEEKAQFGSNDKSLDKIWEVSWRTARLCAGETYFDCPYYEQLQYIGDTRIQALISLYVSGDDRLMRNAIQQFNLSRVPEGLTFSRYPSHQLQIIPPFSLIWALMVNDYYWHRKDDDFVKKQLEGVKTVLNWYEKKLNQENILANMGWWNFVDWNAGFDRGTPKGAVNSEGSTVISLLYVLALQKSAELFQHYGQNCEAEKYAQLAQKIKKSVQTNSYDSNRKMFADTPKKQDFSQHANILAVLTNTAQQPKELVQLVLQDTSITQASIYFKFYLFEAMRKVGLADLYLEQLGFWHKSIKDGLSTFPETETKMRSDCHAWSASPCYDFLATVCGIMPEAAGFEQVKIQPHFGKLQQINAKMPHPKGMIIVDLKKTKKGTLEGNIQLPNDLKGNFLWNGKQMNLVAGNNKINQ